MHAFRSGVMNTWNHTACKQCVSLLMPTSEHAHGCTIILWACSVFIASKAHLSTHAA